MTAILRLRILLAALAMGVVAATATAAFDQWIWTLALAVALPTLVTLTVRSRPFIVRLVASVLGVVASVWLVVAAEGGSTDAVVDAATAGAQRLLTTEWPSPVRPDLVGAVALLLAVTTAVATGLAGQRRTHLAAWVPIIASFIVVLSLSAPGGTRLIALVPLSLIAAIFAALRPDAPLTDRWATLRGEHRLIPLLLVAALTAAAISVPLALSVRADPRRNDPPERTAALLDPIESTLALRALDPVRDLHEITATDGDVLPSRWRTAALSDYDGQRWTPTLTLRPIGRRLASDSANQIDVAVTFTDGDLSLVPLPGSPVTVDAPVETDVDRTVVRLAERHGDEPLTLTAEVAPSLAVARDTGIASRPIDESVSGLSEFAAELAGEGTVLEQLRQIESTMRDEWTLQRDVPGGGLQRTLIERFVRDTQRGTAEQFATSYVLLVRSLGVDARVATGFIATSPPSGGTVVLTSAEAVVWPEVRLTTGGWAALNPVPAAEDSDSAPPPESPAVQTPAAAQPPIAPPPDVGNDATDDDDAVEDPDSRSLSALRLWGQRLGLGLTALLLPALLIVLVILGMKWHRRRKLLRGEAASRIAGAWVVATNRLVDAGMTISPAATDGDIATSGVALVTGAERDLQRLATLSSAVTFGHPARPDLLAEDAVTCLGHVESKMADDRTRAERLKWRLSLRSVRKSTRSPVGS